MYEIELQEKTANLERREAALRADRMRFDLGSALTEAKCRPDAVPDAINVMMGTCAVDLDDDGRPTKYTMGGQDYKTASEAAAAFLAPREYLHDKAPEQKKAAAERPQPSPQTVVAEAWARPDTKKPPQKHALPSANLEDLLKAGHSASDLASEGWATPPK